MRERWVILVLWTRIACEQFEFTSGPFTSYPRQYDTITPYGNSGQTDGPDNLELLPNCEFPAACEDETPVCGSNCQMYPNVCYMKYITCIEHEDLTTLPLSYCTDQRKMALEPLPAEQQVLYGQDTTLTCQLAEGSGLPATVAWYGRGEHGMELLTESEEGGFTLYLQNITQERTFFCQVSNCKKEIVQSSRVRVSIPENVCLIYGTGHVRPFTQPGYSHHSECTYVAAMDALRGQWFVYVRYETTWQISTPSLSTVTLYYNYVPIELQRGWAINYLGSKVIVKEGQQKEMFGMRLTFDGLYLHVSTPEVTLHWDGLGSLIIGVSPDDLTAGLCGNNQRGTPFQGRHRRSRRPTTLPDIVTSWSLRSRTGCNVVESGEQGDEAVCQGLNMHGATPEIAEFFKDSCSKDSGMSDLMAGTTPTYCWTQLALYHLQDRLTRTIVTDRSQNNTNSDVIDNTTGDVQNDERRMQYDGGVGNGAPVKNVLADRNAAEKCELSVVRRQYLAFYSGCPSDTTPFDVT